MKTTFKPSTFSACRIALAAILSAVASAGIASAQTTYLWTGAGADMNWSTTGNWSPAGSPGAADTAVFGSAATTGDSTTANNMISADTTVASLIYTNTGSGVWNVTGVPFGMTLTAGDVTVGGLSGNVLTDVAMTDGGTLMVQGDLTVGNLPTGNQKSTLDLSGLSNFVYNASAGTITFGPGNHSYTDVILAAVSNNITAGTISDNYNNTSSSSSGTLTFGIGTNIVNVGTFNIAAGRNTTAVQFAGAGGLRIRGVNGTDDSLANMTLGYHNTSGSKSTANGTLAFNGIPVDIRLGTLTLGRSDHTPTGISVGSGTVSFDTGTVFANTVLMAIT
ncbi:MAG: hypothetical protein ACRED1_10590, partial [Limisphaerales bacterium]